MTIEFDAKTLLKTMLRMCNIADRKSVAQILSHVLFRVLDDTTIEVVASDGNHMLAEVVEAVVFSNNISFALNANTLLEILKKSEGKIKFNLHDDNKMHIAFGKSKFVLPFLNGQDFPLLFIRPHTESIYDEHINSVDNGFRVKSDVFKRAIDLTKFSMSTEEARFNINGIYLHTDDSYLYFIATDIHRLSKVVIERPYNCLLHNGVIISRKTVMEIRKLIEDHASVSISMFGAVVCFEFGKISLYSRIIDGQFPDYQGSLSMESEYLAIVDRISLIKAVERVSIVAPEKTNFVRLFFSANLLSASSESQDFGAAEESIDIEYDGLALTYALNCRYILDILYGLESNTVHIKIAQDLGPFVIRDPAYNKNVFIVMPMLLR